MTKVVNINQVREIKNDRLKGEQEVRSIEGSVNYFSLGWVRVDFGGEFVRSLMEKLDQNRETVIKVIGDNCKQSKKILGKVFSEDEEGYSMVLDSLDQQTEKMVKIAKRLRTPQGLDIMYRDDSENLYLIEFVLMVVMVCSYSKLEYHKMIRDSCLKLSSTVGNFMNSTGYRHIKGLI